jgi:hypothetical protein
VWIIHERSELCGRGFSGLKTCTTDERNFVQRQTQQEHSGSLTIVESLAVAVRFCRRETIHCVLPSVSQDPHAALFSRSDFCCVVGFVLLTVLCRLSSASFLRVFTTTLLSND